MTQDLEPKTDNSNHHLYPRYENFKNKYNDNIIKIEAECSTSKDIGECFCFLIFLNNYFTFSFKQIFSLNYLTKQIDSNFPKCSNNFKIKNIKKHNYIYIFLNLQTSYL